VTGRVERGVIKVVRMWRSWDQDTMKTVCTGWRCSEDSDQDRPGQYWGVVEGDEAGRGGAGQVVRLLEYYAAYEV